MKMALVKAIVMVCLIVSFTGAYAQKNEDELDEDEVQLLNQINVIDKSSSSSSSQVLIVQAGNLNEAYVQQINSNSGSIESLQLGYANFINLNQEGYLYSIRVVQAGHNNRYGADIDAYDADINVFQVGHFNTIDQTSEINNANLIIIQIGDGHQLTQERDISNSQGMRIIQRGNGAKAIIR
jgi:hypothetical protein